jgi:hypothetical protein
MVCEDISAWNDYLDAEIGCVQTILARCKDEKQLLVANLTLLFERFLIAFPVIPGEFIVMNALFVELVTLCL